MSRADLTASDPQNADRNGKVPGHETKLDEGCDGAKAFGGLLDTLQRDPKALGQRVCFIHTGGIFSLFPFREPLSRLLDS